ncbi:hypothetical protein G7K_1829-t1 [Saitoella complicata NRRL Y-17804]|uniref:Altered inheritance of mitochondria protein 21 n=1 Tax=Saitoella complicata (strain BCRC 22490 / CBS 7301 / JCM 7358 / NBRC 10748 / NRRL Y-17804) TaxID=698492 RepID=A0A0E9NCR4_SAICN|nr:hypothetical protein G7K_1829-t1 [Saitoella complicata NRRL Y-17804]
MSDQPSVPPRPSRRPGRESSPSSSASLPAIPPRPSRSRSPLPHKASSPLNPGAGFVHTPPIPARPNRAHNKSPLPAEVASPLDPGRGTVSTPADEKTEASAALEVPGVPKRPKVLRTPSGRPLAPVVGGEEEGHGHGPAVSSPRPQRAQRPTGTSEDRNKSRTRSPLPSPLPELREDEPAAPLDQTTALSAANLPQTPAFKIRKESTADSVRSHASIGDVIRAGRGRRFSVESAVTTGSSIKGQETEGEDEHEHDQEEDKENDSGNGDEQEMKRDATQLFGGNLAENITHATADTKTENRGPVAQETGETQEAVKDFFGKDLTEEESEVVEAAARGKESPRPEEAGNAAADMQGRDTPIDEDKNIEPGQSQRARRGSTTTGETSPTPVPTPRARRGSVAAVAGEDEPSAAEKPRRGSLHPETGEIQPPSEAELLAKKTPHHEHSSTAELRRESMSIDEDKLPKAVKEVRKSFSEGEIVGDEVAVAEHREGLLGDDGKKGAEELGAVFEDEEAEEAAEEEDKADEEQKQKEDGDGGEDMEKVNEGEYRSHSTDPHHTTHKPDPGHEVKYGKEIWEGPGKTEAEEVREVKEHLSTPVQEPTDPILAHKPPVEGEVRSELERAGTSATRGEVFEPGRTQSPLLAEPKKEGEVWKGKPVVPPRPASGRVPVRGGPGKISALRANLENKLNLGAGGGLFGGPPPVKPKPAPKPVEAEGEEEEKKDTLGDVRKGRARGPARRKPVEKKEEKGGFAISEIVTILNIPGSSSSDATGTRSRSDSVDSETQTGEIKVEMGGRRMSIYRGAGIKGDDVVVEDKDDVSEETTPKPEEKTEIAAGEAEAEAKSEAQPQSAIEDDDEKEVVPVVALTEPLDEQTHEEVEKEIEEAPGAFPAAAAKDTVGAEGVKAGDGEQTA